MANSGDALWIDEANAYGLRHYYEGSFTFTKAGTIKGVKPFGAHMIGNVRANRTYDFGGGGAIYDNGTAYFENLYLMGQAVYLHANGGTVHFKNCIFDLSYAGYIDGYTAFNHNGAIYQFDNCLFFNAGSNGAVYFASGRGTNAVMRFYHCAFINCLGYAVNCVAGEGASFDIQNCVVLGQGFATSWNLNGQDHVNCDYNAVSGSDTLGAHDITGLTWAQAAFASDGLQLGASSVLYAAGQNCGVVTDAYGVSRTVYSIGPFEFGNKNPGVDKVIAPTAYWINGTAYAGTLPANKVMFPYGTLPVGGVAEVAGGARKDCPEAYAVKDTIYGDPADPLEGEFECEGVEITPPTISVTDAESGNGILFSVTACNSGATTIFNVAGFPTTAFQPSVEIEGVDSVEKNVFQLGSTYWGYAYSDVNGAMSAPVFFSGVLVTDGTEQTEVSDGNTLAGIQMLAQIRGAAIVYRIFNSDTFNPETGARTKSYSDIAVPDAVLTTLAVKEVAESQGKYKAGDMRCIILPSRLSGATPKAGDCVKARNKEYTVLEIKTFSGGGFSLVIRRAE